LLAVHRRDAPDDSIGDDQNDRCRFQHAFDHGPVPCAAFQSLPFIAATSYGKPLGTHIACAHLRAGESRRNQFYPRCALGGERERLRWVANIGPGTVEVARSLQAEFEGVASRYRHQLIAAKAALLSDVPPRRRQSRDALAALAQEFLAEVEAFISVNADRISQTGFSAASINSMAATALLEWQGDRRLDLPSIDEEWIGRTAPEVEPAGAAAVDASGLLIAGSDHPPVLRLTGQIDQANLSAVAAALDQARRTATQLQIDVSGLTFCSVGGIRLLVEAVASGDVQLTGIPPHMASAFSAADFQVEESG
jgi:ABC-type transporter Mla MlaB component